jgi:TonB family protein
MLAHGVLQSPVSKQTAWNSRSILGMGVVLVVGACEAANDHGRPAPAESPEVRPPFDAAERACNGQAPLPHDEFSYGADVAPRRLEYVAAQYPKEAARLRIRGIVILQAVIGTDGVVRQTRIIRSIPMLDDAAGAAVCRWRFTPAHIGGAAIAVAMTVTVEFPPTER